MLRRATQKVSIFAKQRAASQVAKSASAFQKFQVFLNQTQARQFQAPTRKFYYAQQVSASQEVPQQGDQSEYNVIIQNFNEAKKFFNQSQFAAAEEIYEQLFDLLYSAEVSNFPKPAENTAPLQQEFENLIKHLDHMTKEGHALTRLPIYKAHWAIAGIFQQMGFLEQAQNAVDEALALALAIEDKKDQKNILPLLKITKGSILSGLKKIDEAIELHKEAIKEVGVQINNENGMQIASAYAEIASHYLDRNSVPAAIRNMARAFTLAESFFGWTHPKTAQIAYQLAKMYLENNHIDNGIIMAEKALIGLEIHHASPDPRPIATMGAYLAKCYEKKKSVEMQQGTISRTINLLKRRQEYCEPQLYEESVFKLQNIMGACRFLLNETMIAATIFQRLNKTAEKIMPEWLKRDPQEAQFELAYMKYFRGASLVKLKRFNEGIASIEESMIQFERCGQTSWVEQAKRNIAEAQELKNKPEDEQEEKSAAAPKKQ